MASQTKKCPSCRTAVELDAQHCPNCPYSFPEEGSGVPERRYGRKPPEPVLWVLILAVVGLGCWRVVNFVMNYADSEAKSNPISQATRSLAGPASPSSEQQAAATAARQLAAGGAPQPQADMSAIEISHEARPAGVLPKAAKAPRSGAVETSRDASAAVTEWRFRGKVFNLVSLAPVSGVRMAFKDPQSGRKVETVTDAKGAYRVVVPALGSGSYSLVIDDPNYAPAYMNPSGENVRALSAAVRLKAADELSRSLDPPYEVQGGARPVETDLYIAPRRVDAPDGSN